MKTVLFDLDGTLLPMDQEVFIKAYLGALAKALAPQGYAPEALISAIWSGTGAMVKNQGAATNEAVFWDTFSQIFGPEARKDEPLFTAFYENQFQQVRLACGFDPQAAQVVRYLKDRGCRVVLATNPIFPAIATYSRIRWAGLEPEDFALITTYENASHCRPNPMYYQEILRNIAENGHNCIMVGNDVGEDMIAKELGMEVFLLTDHLINKTGQPIDAYPQGSFPELLAFLERRI
jgi:FMN phosphatase YigB (HAD superfamily)